MSMEEHPVRLVLVDLSRDVGIVQRSLWELATRLPRERFAVRVWLSADTSADVLAEALEACDFGVERFDEPSSRWDPRTPFHLWLKLRRERPQLVHVHHAESGAVLRIARAAQADGVPVVITRHAEPALEPETRRVYERADAVVTVARGAAGQLADEGTLRRERVRWIPYGTDTADEDAERPVARAWRDHLGARPYRPLWVCPLRLERHRGHEVLLEALAEVRRRELDFVAAFGGDGPLRPELERRAHALGLERQVRFLEVAEHLDALLAAADVVVFPVLEGPLPLTLLDAMARARPVAASAIPPVLDVIESGTDGTLVPAGEPLALAEALETFHRRPDAAIRMGRAAAHKMGETFAWDRVVAAYEDAYDEVLGLASFVPGNGVRSRR
jgi:glycosyltransferase involved in cell wall biosynthesis